MPQGRSWLRRRRRTLTGPEKLLLQGLTPSQYPVAVLTQDGFGRLAGEAFNGFALLIVLTAFYSTCEIRWSTI